MDKELVNVFELMLKYKNLKIEYLDIDFKIEIYIAKIYFKHKCYKKWKYMEFRRNLIMYCIDNSFSFKESISSLIEEKII